MCVPFTKCVAFPGHTHLLFHAIFFFADSKFFCYRKYTLHFLFDSTSFMRESYEDALEPSTQGTESQGLVSLLSENIDN